MNLNKWFNSTVRPAIQLFLSDLTHKLGRHRFHADQFAITQFDVLIPELSAAFDGYKIAHIADIHMGHWITPDRMYGVVGLINQQNPDLIAITGDFVSYVVDEIALDLTQSMKGLSPKDASVAVLGNHDHWIGAHRVRSILQAAGVIELPNKVHSLQRGNQRLHIAGVDDIMVGNDRLDLVLEMLPQGEPAILLAHEPDFADTSSKTNRFSLQLSGHSHGGQIVWPGIGPLIRGPYFYKYPKGIYQVGNMVQYTTTGIGTHVFRVRMNCPPEIAIITLRQM